MFANKRFDFDTSLKRMTFTKDILELQSALVAAGYVVEETPVESCGWLAYAPERDATFAYCCSNKKPPHFCITADDILIAGDSHKFATFSVRGQAGDSDDTWMQIQIYSVPFVASDTVLSSIPLSKELCRAAWNAAVAAYLFNKPSTLESNISD